MDGQVVGVVASAGMYLMIPIVVGLSLFFRVRGLEQRRKMFEAALAANQPELAREFLKGLGRPWEHTARWLACAGAGLALLIVVPVFGLTREGWGFPVAAAVLVGLGLPAAVYSYIRERQERRKQGGANHP